MVRSEDYSRILAGWDLARIEFAAPPLSSAHGRKHLIAMRSISIDGLLQVDALRPRRSWQIDTSMGDWIGLPTKDAERTLLADSGDCECGQRSLDCLPPARSG